jgi:hypothetical protein
MANNYNTSTDIYYKIRHLQIILNELTLRIYLMRNEKFYLHREESGHPSMDSLTGYNCNPSPHPKKHIAAICILTNFTAEAVYLEKSSGRILYSSLEHHIAL